MFEILVGGLVVIIGVVYGLALFALADHVQDLVIANREFSRDLDDVESSSREHTRLLEDLDDIRRRMETLPSRVEALENRNRITVPGGEDDVVYATGS